MRQSEQVCERRGTFEATVSMKKTFCIKEVLFFLVVGVKVALSLAIISEVLTTGLEGVIELEAYHRIQENVGLWGKDVIIDVMGVSSVNCPEGYEEYSSAVWPGTKQGCLCSDIIEDYDWIHVLPGVCSVSLMGAGCTKVDPQESIPFSYWRDKSVLCVKRVKNLNFYQNMSNFTDISTCGQGQEYQFESLSALGCPITTISNSSTLPYQISSTSFYFTTRTNYPIIDIKSTQYQFCSQYNRSNISPHKEHNYNLEIIELTPCQEVDPRVTVIDEITEKQIFATNERILDVVLDLPVYPEPSDDYVYQLGTVRYPAWTYSCRTSEQYSLSKAGEYLNLQGWSFTIEVQIYLSIIFVSICGILFPCVESLQRIKQLKSKVEANVHYLTDQQIKSIYPNLYEHKNFCSELGKFLFFFLLASVAGIILGLHYLSLDNIFQWLRESKKCTEQSFIQWISEILYELQALQRTAIICALLSICILSVDLLYWIWRTQKGDLTNLTQVKNDLQEIEKFNQMDIATQKQQRKDGQMETEESLMQQDNSNFNLARSRKIRKLRKSTIDFNEFS